MISIYFIRNVLIVLAAVAAAGCSSQYDRSVILQPAILDEAKTVVVLPFVNLSDYPHAEQIVVDQIEGALGLSQFEVKNFEWVKTQFAAQGVEIPDVFDTGTAAATARLVGADIAVGGVVFEYGFIREHRAVSERAVASVRIDLIHADDAQILWSATRVESAGNEMSPNRPTMNEVGDQLFRQAFADMQKALVAWRETQLSNPDAATLPEGTE